MKRPSFDTSFLNNARVTFGQEVVDCSLHELAANFKTLNNLIQIYKSSEGFVYECDNEYEFELIQQVVKNEDVTINETSMKDKLVAAEKLEFILIDLFYKCTETLFIGRHLDYLRIILSIFKTTDRMTNEIRGIFYQRCDKLSDDDLIQLITDYPFLRKERATCIESRILLIHESDYFHTRNPFPLDKYLKIVWKDGVGELSDIISKDCMPRLSSYQINKIASFILKHDPTNPKTSQVLLELLN